MKIAILILLMVLSGCHVGQSYEAKLQELIQKEQAISEKYETIIEDCLLTYKKGNSDLLDLCYELLIEKNGVSEEGKAIYLEKKAEIEKFIESIKERVNNVRLE